LTLKSNFLWPWNRGYRS